MIRIKEERGKARVWLTNESLLRKLIISSLVFNHHEVTIRRPFIACRSKGNPQYGLVD